MTNVICGMGNFIQKRRYVPSVLYRVEVIFKFDESVSRTINVEIVVHLDGTAFGPLYFHGVQSETCYTQEIMYHDFGNVNNVELCVRRAIESPSMINELQVLSIKTIELRASSVSESTFSVDGVIHMNDVSCLSVLLGPKTRRDERTEDAYDPFTSDVSVSVEAV